MGKGRWQHELPTVTTRSRKANNRSQRTSMSYQSRVRCKAHARFIGGESAVRHLPIPMHSTLKKQVWKRRNR